jgi:hypothetical protein
MTEQVEDIFKTMTASRILVAILSSGSINIPVDNFISANNEDKQLSVTYNDETNSFQFELREEENEGNSEIIDN